MSYQIASLFHMYIDMGERIAGKQDRFSLIIEDPLRAPKIPPKYKFWPINEKMVFKIVSPCCTYVSTVMRSAFADTLVPLVPWILCKAQHDPKFFFLINFNFFNFYFNLKGFYQIASIFDM